MNPKVSIITVAYNAESYIEDTIQSVLNQSYSNIEYIIIDGASRDSTLTICNKYKDKISKIVSEPDKGIYDAMNKGVNLATGDVIGILNADDFYINNEVIENIVNVFKHSSANCVYADLVYVNQDDTDLITRKWHSGIYQSGDFLKGWMPPHPTFFLEKKWYDKYGVYNLSLKSAADYELMLRMVHRYGLKTGYLDQVITKMRIGGVSNASFKNRIKANREDKKAWELNGLKPGMFTLLRKPLSKIVQFLNK